MIRDRLPKDLNYVPPTDTIIDCIAQLEDDLETYRKMVGDAIKGIVKLRAEVGKIQKDFDLLKGYLP